MPIFFEILRQIFRLKVLKGEQLVVLDAPLLFESKVLEYLCHPIVVDAVTDKEKQRGRLISRNKGLDQAGADDRINSQMPMEARIAKADIVIDNCGSKEELEAEVTKKTLPTILKELRLHE